MNPKDKNNFAFFDQAVVVASDGDYAGLANFLKSKNVFKSLISPNNKYSFLLRKLNIPILYLDTQKNILDYNIKKAPDRDGTL